MRLRTSAAAEYVGLVFTAVALVLSLVAGATGLLRRTAENRLAEFGAPIGALEARIEILENQGTSSDVDLASIEERLTKFEGIIATEPQKLVTIPLLTQRVEIFESQLAELRAALARERAEFNTTVRFSLGILGSLFVAVASLVIKNFIGNPKSTPEPVKEDV